MKDFGMVKCVDCGTICVKTSTNQKRCLECREDQKKEQSKKSGKERYERERRKGDEKKKLVPHPRTTPPGQAGTGCTRSKKCRYGADRDYIGTCNYSSITGKCKVIEVNGRKTVAPTKDCPFFEPRGKKKEKLRKPMTVKGKNGRPVKAVLQLDMDGNVLREFESMVAAAKAVGIGNTGGISAVCAGKQRTAGGYRWKFKEET